MKFVSYLIALFSFALFITPAFAHGPTPQKVDESIIINVDSDKVWQQLKAFDSLAKWHPDVESIKMEDEMTRIVTLKTGGEVTDSLDELNEDEHYVSYRLLTENVSAFPVSFYTISIQVAPEGAGSKVSWSGRFYRGDTGNFPPENLNDAAAVKVMTDYATSGLSGLKKLLED